MAEQMLTYIKEQPTIWKQIVDDRKNITKEFVDFYEQKDLERIVLVGSGSSNSACQIAKECFERLIGIETTVIEPTRLSTFLPFVDNKKTMFCVVSQSGKSTSTIWAIEELRKHGLIITSLTANSDSIISKLSDIHVLINCGDEIIGPKTKGTTSTALTLYLLGLELGLIQNRITNKIYNRTITDLYNSFNNATLNIENSIIFAKEHEEALKTAPHMIFVADGINLPVATEGALKVLETLYIPVFAYEFEEYLHGVNNTINTESWIFLVINDNKNRERMLGLFDFSAGYGSHNYIVSTGQSTGKQNEVNLKSTGNDLTLPFETLIPFHIISTLISDAKGINCDKRRFEDFAEKLNTKA